MELELGLAPPNCVVPAGLDLNKKRDFSEAFEKITLPLLWNDDDHGGDGVVVGWPPIKRTSSSRGRGKCVKVKKEGVGIGRKVDLSLHHSYNALFNTLNNMFPNQHDGEMCVGAEGDDAPEDLEMLRYHFTVTYEDGDGDWMLVGDVPWETFVQSVNRLKILTEQAAD